MSQSDVAKKAIGEVGKKDEKTTSKKSKVQADAKKKGEEVVSQPPAPLGVTLEVTVK